MIENRNSMQEDYVAAISKERKLAKKVSFLTAIAIVISICWLFFSFSEVVSLRKEVKDLNDKKEKVQQEIKDAREALIAIHPLLEKYGVIKSKLTSVNTKLIKQSLEANRELQKNASSQPSRQKAITVYYFPKDVDSNKVETALRELGFTLKIRSPLRPDLPTNLISFGDHVNPNDAKLVAYTLMRAGIEIKGMCRTSIESRNNVVQVLGDQRLLGYNAMTVDSIRDKKDFIRCPKNDVLTWPNE